MDSSASLSALGSPAASLEDELKGRAREAGFDLVGIAPAVSPAGFSPLTEWLACGYAGEMSYIERRREAYSHPSHVLPAVRSVMVLGANYHVRDAEGGPSGTRTVARYACSAIDYHDRLRGWLKTLADFLHQRRPGCRTRGVVDTAPLLERDFARRAGLGWFGKNTMLIHRRLGSHLLLAALLTDVELTPDEPHETSHCGTCTRCLEACPTGAFTAPYVLDARRCLSYLTIELRDRPIPLEWRASVGDWLFGCDICQDVCPWNRKSPSTGNPAFLPRSDLPQMDPVELLSLSVEEFNARYGTTPLSRPGHEGMRRNAAISLGSSPAVEDARAISALIGALGDASPLVRGAAAWALGERGGEPARRALEQRGRVETNAEALEEIRLALAASIDCGGD